MKATWTAEGFAVEPRARRLADDLGLNAALIQAFDFALGRWLAEYRDFVGAPKLGQLPGAQVDGRLRACGRSLQTSDSGRLYVWARLAKANDGLWAFAFEWPVTGPLLSRHIEDATPESVQPDEVAAVVRYLDDAADSPNSGLIDNVWSLAQAAGALEGRPEIREAVLTWILRVVKRRSFHHNLRDLLRVLRAAKPGDANVEVALYRFEPENDQGAAKVARVVIRACRGRPGWMAEAAELLTWLVAARRQDPTARWLVQRDRLSREVGSGLVNEIARAIRSQPGWARHEPTGWRDELFWFMWKSASWHLGERVEPLLK